MKAQNKRLVYRDIDNLLKTDSRALLPQVCAVRQPGTGKSVPGRREDPSSGPECGTMMGGLG